MMKRITAAGACLTLALLGQEPEIVVFDVPNALSTSANGILPAGKVIGNWTDSRMLGHGFIRDRHGRFTTIDVPGATVTIVSSFNLRGTIAGNFVDAQGAYHGFLRSRRGEFTTFDVPDAGQNRGQGTFAQNVNEAGTVGGYYIDKNGAAHGFTGTPGNFTTFDAPGATSTYTGSVECLNPAGDVVGGFPDARSVNHAYVRNADGVLTQIDVSATSSTFATGISPGGAISGFYFEPGSLAHAYVRNRQGEITVFDYPGAVSTRALNMTANGHLTGFYLAVNLVAHGFVGQPGSLKSFDAPGAGLGRGQGTFGIFNEPDGTVVGYVIDGEGRRHGFLRRVSRTREE